MKNVTHFLTKPLFVHDNLMVLPQQPQISNSLYPMAKKREFYQYLRTKFYYSYVRKQLSKYMQHGKTTTMRHARNVAFLCFSCAKQLERKFHTSFDYEALIVGAYLHDLFLYDWHEKNAGHRLHGFSHPAIASQNAQVYCHINGKEQAIIESHMWPLTITKLPKSREAVLVCFFDKVATFWEVMKETPSLWRKIGRYIFF